MNYAKMLEYCTNDEQKIELLRRSKLTQCYHSHPETKKRIFFFYWCEESQRMIVVNPQSTVTKVKVYSPHNIAKHYAPDQMLTRYFNKLMDLQEKRDNGYRKRDVLSLTGTKDRLSQA